jgi:hypothetical protein
MLNCEVDPVALKVTGLPVMKSPFAVADIVFAPAATVQPPTVATPSVLLCATAPDSDPAPPVITKVTVVPATGLANTSRRITAGSIGSSAPTGAS